MSCYSTDKVIFHPKVVQSFMARCSHEMFPIFIHLMPQNFCNQNCHFCSYRMEGWKNSIDFDKRSCIPKERMIELVHEFHDMGIKAIEITGGGEPLVYPYISDLLGELATVPIDTALVTNGTMLNENIANQLYRTHLKWARVSIDAGNQDDYVKIRRCVPNHWDAAWRGVDNLVSRSDGTTIGTGYVITDQNYGGIYDMCARSKDHGVDNVRVSVAFTSKGADIFTVEQKHIICDLLDKAHGLDCENFQVMDLYEERLNNLRFSADKQDYDYCGTKDLLCVIEGECNVYTCCTLTGMKEGLIGNINKQSLSKLWVDKVKYRENFDPRKMCKCTCLYEKRNKVMLGLMNPPDHVNFI